ncbi:MAG: hypothetical protein WCO89_08750, partial [Syntrophus sp. (in: bacteria)]
GIVTCPFSVIFTATDIFRISLLSRYSLLFYFAHIYEIVKNDYEDAQRSGRCRGCPPKRIGMGRRSFCIDDRK